MTAIVCGSGRRALKVCGTCRKFNAHLQCDWIVDKSCTPNGPDKPRTCDAWICAGCALKVGTDRHLCPEHATLWAAHPKNPTNQSPAAPAAENQERHDGTDA